MTERQSKDQETRKRERKERGERKEVRGEKRDREENKRAHVPRDLTLMVTQFHGNQPIHHNNDTGPLMKLEPL